MEEIGSRSTIIVTERLTKRYGDVLALDRVDIHIDKGEIYGFLGPNGAGKTTTIMLLLGLIAPTSGRVLMYGKEVKTRLPLLFSKIGVMEEEQHFYDEMSIREYLAFYAELVGVQSKQKIIEECLAEVGMADFAHRRIHTLSHGMRQKLALTRALLCHPELLFLDEPVSGLDPAGIKMVRELLLKLKERGTTIFISSHVLSEVERLADRVGILSRGKLLAEGSINYVREITHKRMVVEVELSAIDAQRVLTIINHLQELPFVLKVESQSNNLNIEIDTKDDIRPQISRMITENGGVIIKMGIVVPTLEDAFVTITENNLSDLSNLISGTPL